MTPEQIDKAMELADRYRNLRVGEGTAQARTALHDYLLSTIKKTLTVQPDNMPDCWVVVKNGKILGTHNEPAHIDGLQAVRYVPAQPSGLPFVPWSKEADMRESWTQPAQPKQEALTQAQRSQVFDCAETSMRHNPNLSWRDAICDALESAHGIGEKT